MHLNEIARIRFLWHGLAQRIDGKTAGLAAATLALILFGDSLLPVFGHGLYLLLEVMEQGSEDLLEYAFGLSTRQAQIVLVWGGLPILLFLLWRWLRKPYAALKARWTAFLAWVNSDWSRDEWLRITSFIGVLGLILFLIS